MATTFRLGKVSDGAPEVAPAFSKEWTDTSKAVRRRLLYSVRCNSCGFERDASTSSPSAFGFAPCPICSSSDKEILGVELHEKACTRKWFAIAAIVGTTGAPPRGPWRALEEAVNARAEWTRDNERRAAASAVYAYDTREHARHADLFHGVGGPEGRIR